MLARLAPETVIAAVMAVIAVGVALWAVGDGDLAKAVALFWPLTGASLVALLLGAMRREPDAGADNRLLTHPNAEGRSKTRF